MWPARYSKLVPLPSYLEIWSGRVKLSRRYPFLIMKHKEIIGIPFLVASQWHVDKLQWESRTTHNWSRTQSWAWVCHIHFLDAIDQYVRHARTELLVRRNHFFYVSRISLCKKDAGKRAKDQSL